MLSHARCSSDRSKATATKATVWRPGSPGSTRVCGRRIGGCPGGSVCGNGIRAHSGPLRSGCRGRPGQRSNDGPLALRPSDGSLTLGADPDCPEELTHNEPRSTLRQWASATIRDMSQIRERNPMSPEQHEHCTTFSHPGRRVTRLAPNPLQHHTHVQRSC